MGIKLEKVANTSRYARKKSDSKVYHAMLSRMPLFFDNDDGIRFLETLDRMKSEIFVRSTSKEEWAQQSKPSVDD